MIFACWSRSQLDPVELHPTLQDHDLSLLQFPRTFFHLQEAPRREIVQLVAASEKTLEATNEPKPVQPRCWLRPLESDLLCSLSSGSSPNWTPFTCVSSSLHSRFDPPLFRVFFCFPNAITDSMFFSFSFSLLPSRRPETHTPRLLL